MRWEGLSEVLTENIEHLRVTEHRNSYGQLMGREYEWPSRTVIVTLMVIRALGLPWKVGAQCKVGGVNAVVIDTLPWAGAMVVTRRRFAPA